MDSNSITSWTVIDWGVVNRGTLKTPHLKATSGSNDSAVFRPRTVPIGIASDGLIDRSWPALASLLNVSTHQTGRLGLS